MPRHFKRSTSALAVLVLLYEAPMHPYKMRRLIQERGKDKVINIRQQASLYQTIGQLQRSGLITVRQTARRERRPERTVYELTEKGIETLRTWMADILSAPGEEYPEFPAAISLLAVLTPKEVTELLQKRTAAIETMHAQIASEMRGATGVPRLFLLEDEYRLALLEAEQKWIRALLDDLRSGNLTWSEEWVRRFIPPDTDA